MLSGVVLAALALGGFMVFRGNATSPSPAIKQTSPVAVRNATSPEPTKAPVETYSGLNLESQLGKAVPPGNPIEQARNATVFLKTAWGRGAGFFIDDKCFIVTNKHVVKLSEEDIAEAEAQINEMKNEAEKARKMISSNKEVYPRLLRGEVRLRDRRLTTEMFAEKIKDDEKKAQGIRAENSRSRTGV